MIWKIDPTHSHVSFTIRVLGVTTTKGRFNALRGQLALDEQNPASSWVEAEVEAASIDTHNITKWDRMNRRGEGGEAWRGGPLGLCCPNRSTCPYIMMPSVSATAQSAREVLGDVQVGLALVPATSCQCAPN